MATMDIQDETTFPNELSTGGPNLTIPREIQFTGDSLVSVIIYAVVFVIAAVGNLTVLVALCMTRKNRSRVNLFIMHLSIADLIVTFIMVPMEIGWHVTVAWKAGDAGCRIFMFFRTFGFYLSSLILVAISLDLYFAITRPLGMNTAAKRGKIMLAVAWVVSVAASIPQSVIFHQETHPGYPWFSQCVTFNFFPSPKHELAYNLFNFILVYLAPLIAIIICYSLIVVELSRRSRGHLDRARHPASGRNGPSTESLRRSDMGSVNKARINTLIMTVIIVAVFIVCWTPYFVILVWWWLDPVSALLVNKKVQRGLFIFAVSNSCVNPIVYGMFSTVFKNDGNSKCPCTLPCLRQRRSPSSLTNDTLPRHSSYNNCRLLSNNNYRSNTGTNGGAVQISTFHQEVGYDKMSRNNGQCQR